ncbi:MAG: AAA family ATPase [Gammaproteobacteria bacterium]
MKELHDLELTLNSRTPIIVIESQEELRIIQLLTQLGMRLPHPLFRWSVTDGLQRLEVDYDPQRTVSEPDDVLKHIKALSRPGIFLLLDFHPYLNDPIHIRLIKEIAQGYKQIQRTLIFLSHEIQIPPELQHLSARFQLQMPDRTAIKQLIQDEAKRWQDSSTNNGRVKVDREAMEKLANNLAGVTATDARRLIRTAIEDDGAITHDDLPTIMQAKYELISKDGVISFEYDTARFSEVAGQQRLKQWLEQRRKAFIGGATALDQPKGIMLLGVQGSGKSLAAKAVAGTFGIPLLRIDFGALYNKFYGETEKNLRHALDTADIMEPCVLWMDEIEKGFAVDTSDDGLSMRMLGSLLTWMAERKSRVFVVATSNDIERLPPELIRKGRLDEIFFVDLPDLQTRQEIFKIHLRKRNLAPSGFDLNQLATASQGFSGAEIEQAIVASRYASQAQDITPDTEQLLQELTRTKPLSVVMAEKVQQLRQWAADRTVPAG